MTPTQAYGAFSDAQPATAGAIELAKRLAAAKLQGGG
jgi:hypothetical protein